MEVQFFYNASDDRVINKRLLTTQEENTFVGVPRDEVSVMNPVIRFESDAILRYNYAYIPELQRYYSIVDRTACIQSCLNTRSENNLLLLNCSHPPSSLQTL